MTEEEKIKAGTLFNPTDSTLKAIKLRTHNLNNDYNATYEDETEKRQAILKQMVGSLGAGSFVQGPVYFHYGIHTHIGEKLFANFNFTVQDDAAVTIGDRVAFGPNCSIVTPVHPMLPDERRLMYNEKGEKVRMCYAKPVTIGNDCWFGANVVVLPGVTVGDNCVIGAGSVVVKNIPANSFAAGNPCRVIRTLTQADSMAKKPEILGDNRVIPPEEWG